MAVDTLGVDALTASLNMPDDGTFVSLLSDDYMTIVSTGDPIRIEAYLYGLNIDQIELQIQVDGTDTLIDTYGISTGANVIVYVTLSAGSHDIAFLGTSYALGQQARSRGMSVVNLT